MRKKNPKKAEWCYTAAAPVGIVCIYCLIFVVRRLLLACSSSDFFFLFFLLYSVFFSPKPGLRGGDKWLLFSVAKKGLRELSAESTGLVGREGGGWGLERQGWGGVVSGKEKKRGREAVKSRSSPKQINSNQLDGTGDGIASLKIQEGQNVNVTVVFPPKVGSLAALIPLHTGWVTTKRCRNAKCSGTKRWVQHKFLTETWGEKKVWGKTFDTPKMENADLSSRDEDLVRIMQSKNRNRSMAGFWVYLSMSVEHLVQFNLPLVCQTLFVAEGHRWWPSQPLLLMLLQWEIWKFGRIQIDNFVTTFATHPVCLRDESPTCNCVQVYHRELPAWFNQCCCELEEHFD